MAWAKPICSTFFTSAARGRIMLAGNGRSPISARSPFCSSGSMPMLGMLDSRMPNSAARLVIAAMKAVRALGA
ncbi:hypothetical protein D3C85_1737000 [compost metagenome]